MERIRSGYDKPYDHLAIRKDGSIFPVEVRGRLMPYNGRMVRVTAIRDLTERKQAEKAMAESEKRYRAVVEDQTEVISRFRRDNPNSQLLVSTGGSGASIFQKDEEALLEFLEPPFGRSGVLILIPYRAFHDPKAGNFVPEIKRFSAMSC